MAVYGKNNPSWRGGYSKTKLYRVWNSMRCRCNNPNDSAYKHYGQRGIAVCEEWKDFNTFYNDIGYLHKEGLWLDRIDNNKGYSKDNCKWSTKKEQARNKRNTRKVTFNDITATLAEWSEITGIKRSTLSMRFHKYKWPINRIFTT